MLGHSSISITLDLYSHVTRTMQQQAADALDVLLAEPLAVNLAVNEETEGAKPQVGPRGPRGACDEPRLRRSTRRAVGV